MNTITQAIESAINCMKEHNTNGLMRVYECNNNAALDFGYDRFVYTPASHLDNPHYSYIGYVHVNSGWNPYPGRA